MDSLSAVKNYPEIAVFIQGGITLFNKKKKQVFIFDVLQDY